jgi:hypothetical protein
MYLLLLTLFSCTSPTPSQAPAEPAPMASAPKARPHAAALALLPADQSAVITRATDGLDELCTKSSRARELRKLYVDNGVEAVLVDHENIQIVSAPDVQYPFLVIGDPRPNISVGTGSFIGAHFGYDPNFPAPIMELRDIGMTTLGAGIALAHELKHAEERFFRNEPPSKYPEPNWIIGEIVAHSAVSTVLNEYTNGGWNKAIDARILRIETFLASQNMDPESAVFGYSPEDAEAIKTLFPGSDNVTIGMFLMQMDVDTNLERVRRMAAKRQLPSEARDKAAIDTMIALYKSMDYQDAK